MNPDVAVALPAYEEPPVIEVGCGLMFRPLAALQIPHVGLFWEKIKHEFPRCEEAPPLAPTIEAYGDTPEFSLEIGTPAIWPRVWFIHADDRAVIQLQRDLMMYNWRKRSLSDAYPRYINVVENFKRNYYIFRDFLIDNKLGSPDIRQCELTYVNLVASEDIQLTLANIGSLFPDFSWNNSVDRFLPAPEGINWSTRFLLPKQCGRLHISIQSGARGPDQKMMIRWDLVARGIGAAASDEDIRLWFNLAHEWIVKGFEDITSRDIQNRLWKKQS